MPTDEKMTRDELAAENSEFKAGIMGLRARITELEKGENQLKQSLEKWIRIAGNAIADDHIHNVTVMGDLGQTGPPIIRETNLPGPGGDNQ